MNANRTDFEPRGETAGVATDTLAGGVALLLGLTVVQRAVGLARGLLFCRWLDPEQLGQWDLAFGFIMFAAPVAVLGLPGSFGRYAEHYRQTGHLRSFLARVGSGTAVLLLLAVLVVAAAAPWFSQLVFGQPDFVALTVTMAVVLAAVIAHNTLVSLFSSLRLFRVASGMTFVQGILFAAAALVLAGWWNASAISIVAAFGAATLLASAGSLFWLARLWRSLPRPATPLRHTALWSKLLPFALWVWTANWLFNLVDLVDRYMIVHCSQLPTAEALALVGQYHSSKVLPLVLQSVAELVAGVLMPYLSFHWESGRRAAVAQQTNLALKLLAFGLSLAAVAVLLARPVLFDVVLAGKYPTGGEVFPWILVFCIWGGLTTVASSFLYCHERVGLNSLTVLVGLVLNVVLNLLWLPTLGLYGVVLATAVSRLVALGLLYTFCWLHGLSLDRGLLALSLVPALLAWGPWPTLAALALLGGAALRGKLGLLSHDDRQQLATLLQRWLARVGWTTVDPAPV